MTAIENKEYLSIVDKNYSYVAVSSSYLKDRGIKSAQIIGKKLDDLWEKETVENVIKPLIDRAFKGEIVTKESWFSFSTKGKKYYATKYIPIYEVGKVTKVAIITRDLTHEKEVYIDSLTKVYNRKRFDIDFDLLVKEKKGFYIFILDLDDFKPVNDKYGHKVGDFVLFNVAKLFSRSLNEMEKVYRIGGDEFAILGRGKTSFDLHFKAKKIIDGLTNITFNKVYKVGVSIGILNVVGKTLSKDTIFAKVDSLMYKSKKAGKNIYSLEEI